MVKSNSISKIEETILIKTFGDSPALRVITFLLENKIFDYPKTEIAKEVGISRATLNLFWNKLIEKRLILKTRTVGKAVMYTINTDSEVIKKLVEIESILAKRQIEKTIDEAHDYRYSDRVENEIPI